MLDLGRGKQQKLSTEALLGTLHSGPLRPDPIHEVTKDPARVCKDGHVYDSSSRSRGHEVGERCFELGLLEGHEEVIRMFLILEDPVLRNLTPFMVLQRDRT